LSAIARVLLLCPCAATGTSESNVLSGKKRSPHGDLFLVLLA